MHKKYNKEFLIFLRLVGFWMSLQLLVVEAGEVKRKGGERRTMRRRRKVENLSWERPTMVGCM